MWAGQGVEQKGPQRATEGESDERLHIVPRTTRMRVSLGSQSVSEDTSCLSVASGCKHSAEDTVGTQ